MSGYSTGVLDRFQIHRLSVDMDVEASSFEQYLEGLLLQTAEFLRLGSSIKGKGKQRVKISSGLRLEKSKNNISEFLWVVLSDEFEVKEKNQRSEEAGIL